MRFSREQLIFKALCALDEAVDQAEDEPIEPSLALRFALAFLYACSNGKSRSSYDGFWRCVVPRQPDRQYREHSLYHAYARDHLRGIAQTLGIDFEHEMRDRIDRARGKPPDARRIVAQAVKDVAAEREAIGEKARKARHCDLSG